MNLTRALFGVFVYCFFPSVYFFLFVSAGGFVEKQVNVCSGCILSDPIDSNPRAQSWKSKPLLPPRAAASIKLIQEKFKSALGKGSAPQMNGFRSQSCLTFFISTSQEKAKHTGVIDWKHPVERMKFFAKFLSIWREASASATMLSEELEINWKAKHLLRSIWTLAVVTVDTELNSLPC